MRVYKGKIVGRLNGDKRQIIIEECDFSASHIVFVPEGMNFDVDHMLEKFGTMTCGPYMGGVHDTDGMVLESFSEITENDRTCGNCRYFRPETGRCVGCCNYCRYIDKTDKACKNDWRHPVVFERFPGDTKWICSGLPPQADLGFCVKAEHPACPDYFYWLPKKSQ